MRKFKVTSILAKISDDFPKQFSDGFARSARKLHLVTGLRGVLDRAAKLPNPIRVYTSPSLNTRCQNKLPGPVAYLFGRISVNLTDRIHNIRQWFSTFSGRCLRLKAVANAKTTIRTTDFSSISRAQALIWVAVIASVALASHMLLRPSTPRQSFQFSGPIVEIPPAIALQQTSGLVESISSTKGVVGLHDPKALNNEAIRLVAGGDFQGGSALMLRALKAAPDDPVINYNHARMQYQEGKVGEAVQSARRALARDPLMDEPKILLGAAALQGRNIAAAQSQVQGLRNLNSVPALLLIGAVALASGDVNGALNAFSQASAISPQRATASYNLGVAYQQQNSNALAQKYYQSAIANNPSLVQARQNLAALSASSALSYGVPPPAVIVPSTAPRFQQAAPVIVGTELIPRPMPPIPIGPNTPPSGRISGLNVPKYPFHPLSLESKTFGTSAGKTAQMQFQRVRTDESMAQQARLQAEQQARVEEEQQARIQAQQARLVAEHQARFQAEQQARLQAEEQARIQAEQKQARRAELQNLANAAQAQVSNLMVRVQELLANANALQAWAAQHAFIQRVSGRRIIMVPNPAAATATANAQILRMNASTLQARIAAWELQIQQLRNSN